MSVRWVGGPRPSSDDPVVRVIVTTYNHERFIARAVESVLDQRTPFSYEVIVIDDCSTDGTLRELDRLSRAHPDCFEVRVAPTNRNNHDDFGAAVDQSSSRYIAMIDGDDFWTSDTKLATQVEFLDQHPDCVLTFHPMVIVDDNDDVGLEPSTFGDWNADRGTHDDLWTGSFFQASSVLFRRHVFDRLPRWYFDSTFGDWELYLFLMALGDAGNIRDILGAYRVHGDGAWSGASPTAQAEQILRFYKHMAEALGPAFTANGIAVHSLHMRLATAYRWAGDRRQAWRWALRAFGSAMRYRPSAPAPPPRRVVGLLLRLARDESRALIARTPR